MNIENLVTDSFLSIIYNNKFNLISQKIRLNSSAGLKQENNYTNILYAIENVPPCFNSTRKNIKAKVDTYIDYSKELDYYKNEEFYKSGFIDGYKFLLELEDEENK